MSTPADPTEIANDFAAEIATRGTLEGYELELTFRLDVRRLPRLVAYLKRLGLEPPRRPLAFDLTAEGHPICPRHGVPMRPREKQGDTWYSHKTLGPQGEELYCRGYPGPDSRCYGGTVPEAQT